MGKTEKDTVARSVRIPADVDELLVEVAEQEDRSISYVIVKALEKLLVPRPATVRSDGVPVVDLDRDAFVSPTGRVSVPQVSRHASPSVQKDANAAYARMMAERQARLQKGR
jgi:hypothetical protein